MEGLANGFPLKLLLIEFPTSELLGLLCNGEQEEAERFLLECGGGAAITGQLILFLVTYC